MDVLVLNTDGQPLTYLPLSVISWQLAIKLTMLEKVIPLAYYDDWEVHSPSTTLKVPSVVMCRDYDRWRRSVKFTRSNVHLRDYFRCQFCHQRFPFRELTYDHIVPRTRGGKTTWDNITTACKRCNNLKSDKHLDPKKLPRFPRKPNYYELLSIRKQFPLTIKDHSWLDYLDWPKDKIVLKQPNSQKICKKL